MKKRSRSFRATSIRKKKRVTAKKPLQTARSIRISVDQKKRLADVGITIDKTGRGRRRGKRLSKRALLDAIRKISTYTERTLAKLKPKQKRGLASLPKEMQAGAIAGAKKRREKILKKRKLRQAQKILAQEAEQKRKQDATVRTAEGELRRAVRAASEGGSRLYGEYNPKTKRRHTTRGTFAGFKRTPFDERAGHVQGRLRDKHPRDYRRDLYSQAVHIREYLSQADGGAGRLSIVEKTLNAGRAALARIGALRVHQIAIGTIRVLLRQQDAGKYGGYSTRPIGKKIRAALDIRGLEGFEKVSPGEDPRAALERILDRLDDHLLDILDGLPVVYVKSLRIMFDVEETK